MQVFYNANNVKSAHLTKKEMANYSIENFASVHCVCVRVAAAKKMRKRQGVKKPHVLMFFSREILSIHEWKFDGWTEIRDEMPRRMLLRKARLWNIFFFLFLIWFRPTQMFRNIFFFDR